MSAVLGGFLAPRACVLGGSAGVFRPPRVNSERYAMAHVRHGGNKALFANFAQTEFSEVRHTWQRPSYGKDSYFRGYASPK